MTGDSVSLKFLPEIEVPDSLYMVGGDLGEVRAGPYWVIGTDQNNVSDMTGRKVN